MPQIEENTVVGFLDESSPQTTANTQRLLSFAEPVLFKNTTKYKANAFGFYGLNAALVIDFKENSRKEDVCDFIKKICAANPGKEIVLILDNFRSHRAKDTVRWAEEFGIKLVFLPPYSPDLNPIEFIWRSIKRVISRSFIKDLEHIRQIISDSERFLEHASSLSFAKSWIERFLEEKLSSVY
ncbi:MAG: Integrase core domain protein [Methanosaeta sp. PtaB.Bin039]|nr:MAG: Integrase core domain protein [Methanosaeta sp. PtaB.Bin039]